MVLSTLQIRNTPSVYELVSYVLNNRASLKVYLGPLKYDRYVIGSAPNTYRPYIYRRVTPHVDVSQIDASIYHTSQIDVSQIDANCIWVASLMSLQLIA